MEVLRAILLILGILGLVCLACCLTEKRKKKRENQPSKPSLPESCPRFRKNPSCPLAGSSGSLEEWQQICPYCEFRPIS